MAVLVGGYEFADLAFLTIVSVLVLFVDFLVLFFYFGPLLYHKVVLFVLRYLSL